MNFDKDEKKKYSSLNVSIIQLTFIDDMDYVNIGERIYLEEAGYWGLLALQERESEYIDVGDANDEKYFG